MKVKLKTTLYTDGDSVFADNFKENGKNVYELFAKKGQIFNFEELTDELAEEYGIPSYARAGYICYAKSNYFLLDAFDDEWLEVVER